MVFSCASTRNFNRDGYNNIVGDREKPETVEPLNQKQYPNRLTALSASP
jgi:hypothetical protein